MNPSKVLSYMGPAALRQIFEHFTHRSWLRARSGSPSIPLECFFHRVTHRYRIISDSIGYRKMSDSIGYIGYYQIVLWSGPVAERQSAIIWCNPGLRLKKEHYFDKYRIISNNIESYLILCHRSQIPQAHGPDPMQILSDSNWYTNNRQLQRVGRPSGWKCCSFRAVAHISCEVKLVL